MHKGARHVLCTFTLLCPYTHVSCPCVHVLHPCPLHICLMPSHHLCPCLMPLSCAHVLHLWTHVSCPCLVLLYPCLSSSSPCLAPSCHFTLMPMLCALTLFHPLFPCTHVLHPNALSPFVTMHQSCALKSMSAPSCSFTLCTHVLSPMLFYPLYPCTHVLCPHVHILWCPCVLSSFVPLHSCLVPSYPFTLCTLASMLHVLAPISHDLTT